MDPYRMVGTAVLSVTSLLIAAANEPSRVQRGLFIAVFVLVVVLLLWWLRRRGDAARWRSRRNRVFADVHDLDRDCDGVLQAPDHATAAAAWSRLEPRAVVCAAELADLAQSGQDPARASQVRRVREALVHLSDQLHQGLARPEWEPLAATGGTHLAEPAGSSEDLDPATTIEAARLSLREALGSLTR